MLSPSLYGIIISLSILTCVLLVQKLSIKSEKDKDVLWGTAFWAIVFGLIGARIYHVLDYMEHYSKNPVDVLALWNGGLGIWGAIFGGCIGIYIYLKRRKENFLHWLDAISVTLPLGQAIGRWGNFFNQEIFGIPTNLPWGIYVRPQTRPSGFESFEKFHPLFLYESVSNLILFGVFFSLYKKFGDTAPKGTFVALYLGSYSVIRFFLEYLRINPWTLNLVVGSLNVSQCISILVLSFSILFIKGKNKKMIYISSDHKGFNLKHYLVEKLSSEGLEIVDLGPSQLDQTDDYPDYAQTLAKKMQENLSENRGIVICGNGVGISVAVNKFKGIRAALSWDVEHVKSSRTDDNSNVLSLPADYISNEKALDIVKTWLNTPFSDEERHARRIGKISFFEEC